MANILRLERPEGRPRHHLHADDSGSGLRHAGLRPIGAIHSVVFGGFSPDSLAQRIIDCKSKVIITADEGLRGGKKVPLKANVDAAIAKAGGVDWVVVVKRTGGKVDMDPVRDVWHHEAAAMVDTDCPVEPMNAEDPLFILYTSGSTGTPKGAAHHRRLSHLRVDDASVCVRLSRRRHLLVHRRRGLGHRPQLHPLWTARQRRDHAHV
jgi:acetyl-CoA synthetase